MEIIIIFIFLSISIIYGISILTDIIKFVYVLATKKKQIQEKKAVQQVSKQVIVHEIEEILYTKSNYYKNLDSENKKKFIKRTLYFITNTEYLGYEGVQITNELKVLIAASAIQLTFGLQICVSQKIKKIRLYPNAMYIRSHNSYVKGFFHPHGIIQLSVKHFYEGHSNQTDGVHLGLHEMAHALEFLLFKKGPFTFLFQDLVTQWIRATKESSDYNYDTNEHSFIRKYGITNTHEFFAVSVENFFERPQEFASKLPMIYKHLCFILNQNPIEPYPTNENLPSHTEYAKPKFTETMHMKQLALLTVISFAIITYLLYSSIEMGSIAPIIFFVSTYNAAKIIEFFTARRLEFYDNYILIRSVLWGNKQIIPTKHLLYISAHETIASDVRKKLSFVYHKQGLKEVHDIFIPNKIFLEQVKAYAKSNNFVYIDKLQI